MKAERYLLNLIESVAVSIRVLMKRFSDWYILQMTLFILPNSKHSV